MEGGEHKAAKGDGVRRLIALTRRSVVVEAIV